MFPRTCVFALCSLTAMFAAAITLNTANAQTQGRGWCVKLSPFYERAPMYRPSCLPDENNNCVPWTYLLHSDGEIGVADDDTSDEYWYLDNDANKYGWVNREYLTKDVRCREKKKRD
jgi:hypothetical protein